MAELNFKKLADAPVLEEVPDGAKVYAEVDGKVYRVAGDNLGGGGIPTAMIVNGDDGYACDNMTFEQACALIDAHQPVMFLLYYNSAKSLSYTKSVKRNTSSLRIDISDGGTVMWGSGGITPYVP